MSDKKIMKAVFYQGFGSPDILRCEDIPTPAPGNNEVLVKVRAASVNPLDWKLMRGGPLLLRLLLARGKPKLKQPGVDVAGIVEAVGSGAVPFKPGDEVFGTCYGAFAEYAATKSVSGLKSQLAPKPRNITFEEAASAPVAGLTALQGLRDKGRLRPGHKVLVNGAAGGVGTFAVQIAKALGAEVTGVCSTANVDLVQSLGAVSVIDYTRQDLTTSGERYDLILDCVGNHAPSDCRRALAPAGTLVMVGAPADVPFSSLIARLIRALAASWFDSRKAVFFVAKVNQKDLAILGELMAGGKVKPVIDRRYALSEAAEAFRYMEAGHARGKVIISPDREAAQAPP